MKRLLISLCVIVPILAQAQKQNVSNFDSIQLWTEGSEWEVFFEPEPGPDGTLQEKSVRYRLGRAENGYMPLDKAEYTNGIEGDTILIGYIRNEMDTMVYVRPILDDGTVGEERMLYDFSTAFEYGGTIRYGLQDGSVGEEYIDWQKDSLQYYIYNGDMLLLPSWNGIIYRYGYIGGPMELFQCNQAPNKKRLPKATNISHVIFSSKGGRKVNGRKNAGDTGFEVCIPYQKMLTEGTKWECLAVSKSNHGVTHSYTVEVKGDTIVGNRSCKLICSPEFNADKIAFEEGRKIYIVNADNEPEVLLDFGIEQDYLIEGIGVSKDEHLKEHCLQSEDDEVISYLLRCWKGNVLVYQAPFCETSSGISRVSTGNNSSLYDLQGRRLHSVPKRGVYINGKKKIIIR